MSGFKLGEAGWEAKTNPMGKGRIAFFSISTRFSIPTHLGIFLLCTHHFTLSIPLSLCTILYTLKAQCTQRQFFHYEKLDHFDNIFVHFCPKNVPLLPQEILLRLKSITFEYRHDRIRILEWSSLKYLQIEMSLF